MKKVTVFAPATSANLGPGFDVLGVALNLYNEVTFEAEMAPSHLVERMGYLSALVERDHSRSETPHLTE